MMTIQNDVIYKTIKDPQEYLRQYTELMSQRTNRLKIEAVLEVLPTIPSGSKILDVGSGGGAYAKELDKRLAKNGKSLSFYCVDAATVCVEAYLLNNPGASGKVGDACACPFPDREFDLVFAIDIIEHIDEEKRFIKEMYRLTKPGGWLVICTQNAWSLEMLIGYLRSLFTRKKWVGWDPTHLRFYSPASLHRILASQGFQIVRFNGTYYIPFYFPARLFSKFFEVLKFKKLATTVHNLIELPFYALNYLFELLSQKFPFRYLGWGIIVLARRD